MKRRYVLDGPPGSGKSTLIFGLSDGDVQGGSPYTLEGLGYACAHESVAEAHEALARQELDYATAREAWLAAIVEFDRNKFDMALGGTTFFDRCFHHWRLFSEISGVSLPDWYQAENERIRYDNPVFLLAPVQSMDLDSPEIHESRRFSWSERLSVFEKTRNLYLGLGYDVVEIPVFMEGDIDQNNRQRIAKILEHIF